MNIVIGKIGSKLIFNRNSSDGSRSNNNGNIDAYNFCRILFDTFPEHKFCIIGRNDYSDLLPHERWENVVSWVDCKVGETLSEFKPDAGFILGGLTEHDAGYRPIECPIVNYLNSHDIPWWMLSTDPRCFCSDPALISRPIEVFSLGNKFAKIGQNLRDVYSLPAMLSLTCYKPQEFPSIDKKIGCVVATSDSPTYPRVDMILELIGNKNINVYGRCLRANIGVDMRFKGEVPAKEMQSLYLASKMTILSPIFHNWFTGKIAESLMFGMVPVFNSDYGFDLLSNNSDLKRLLLCNNKDDFHKRYKLFTTSQSPRLEVLDELKKSINYEGLSNGSAMHDFLAGLIKNIKR